jgi:type II secretory pathway component PulF
VTRSPQYRYRAARADGRIVSGLVDAPSATQATALLAARGLHPVALDVAPLRATDQRPASRRQLAILFRSLAGLTAAGLPIDRALAASQPLARGGLGEATAEARRRLSEGASLADAYAATQGLVPPVVTGMLRAGERGGQLAVTLEQVARHLEAEAELLGRVRQALAYPTLVAVAGTISTLVIGTVVVPRFAELLGDLGQDLPPAARLLLGISSLLVHHGITLLVAVLASVWLVVAWRRSPVGRLAGDRLWLALPVVGPLRHALATARLTRALGGMLASGMPLLSALDAAREAAGDAAVSERVAQARELVAEGKPLTRALESAAAFTPSALQLIAVGEGSGELATMTARAGDLAAQEAEQGLRTLTGLLEPALILLFGGLVALVAAALLQAVYSIRPGG